MLNNMLTSIGTLTFGQSLVLSGIGMLVVLMELAILAVMIIILSKVLGAVLGDKKPAPAPAAAAPAPAPAAPAAVPAAPAPRPAGLVLENVDEPSAAMVMAIVSDKTGIPLNHLDFHSIKGAPVALEGLDDQTAAAVMAIVSKETGIPLSRLSFNSIKKVDR